MQLILGSEATADLKTKMSLSEENLEKCVSEILSDIKKDDICNADITNGIKENAELKDNNDVDKTEQLKVSVTINTDSVIELNNIVSETSQDCTSTNILNGNNSDENELHENSEPLDNLENIKDSDKRIDSSVEENDIERASNSENTEINHDAISENNVNEKVTESKKNIIEHVPICNNINTENTTIHTTDVNSKDNESILDSRSKNDSITSTSERVNIKKDNGDTAVSDIMETNISENNDIKKESVQICSEETDTEVNLTPAVKDDPMLSPETNDIEMQDTTIKTEIAEDLAISDKKEATETNYTETDISDEHIDLIRLDVNPDSCDKANTSNMDETEKDETSAIKTEEKEISNCDDLIEMDVDGKPIDVSLTDTKELNAVTLTESPSENCELKNSENLETTKAGITLGLNLSNSDDVIVNLDDDKDKSDDLVNCNKSDRIIADDDKRIINCDEDTEILEKDETSKSDAPRKPVDEVIDLDENLPRDTDISKLSCQEIKDQPDNTNIGAVDAKSIEPVLKLSNTLNILSDDEDDDVVMLIEDDTSANENKTEPIKEHETPKQSESKSESLFDSLKMTEDKDADKIINDSEKDAAVLEKELAESTPAPDISEKLEENKLQIEKQTPLIPENFLKTCKKNLVDMTREELEEFCILKLVESILDRSNLSEIKNKLKVLTQNIEDYKKKAMMLAKQNRDLQVVLKSIQEDVKKNNVAPVVPLKITRSVGMQVLMADKPDKRRRIGIGLPNANNKQLRNPVMQSPRPQKPPTQPIPVPRLVPANSPALKSPVQQVTTGKVTSPLPNGIKNASPVQKGEKRTHNRMQSVTVDLTDDEPPAKVMNRAGPVPPVRLVPSQNLLAQPRAAAVNSPRKVYIPISGPQAQNVRPGQTIMLKTVPNGNPRQRAPPPHMVRMPQTMRMARPQGLRHPAPLPECMKQYQPPNWKALPPAPDLKLAKVENGIVISWKIEGYQEDSYEEIASYQLYAYQETTSPPNTALWKKIGDVKALPLPMACTLTQFMAGYKYYFAVRAVDIRSRLGPFSLPGSILLLNKM